MKRFLPVFGLLPVLIVPAWASDLGLTAIMRTHKMSALEAAAVVVIADALHVNADFVISTMPVKDLVAGLRPPAPETVRNVASHLPYRAFITVGLLVTRMKMRGTAAGADVRHPRDNWICDRGPPVCQSPFRMGNCVRAWYE